MNVRNKISETKYRKMRRINIVFCFVWSDVSRNQDLSDMVVQNLNSPPHHFEMDSGTPYGQPGQSCFFFSRRLRIAGDTALNHYKHCIHESIGRLLSVITAKLTHRQETRSEYIVLGVSPARPRCLRHAGAALGRSSECPARC